MSWAPQVKKLVSVLTTSLSITSDSREAPKMRVLSKVLCICYPVQFCKDKGKDVLALLNFRSKINAITHAYAAHLGFKVRVINLGAQKINRSSLATYGMIITSFQAVDKLSCSQFF